MKPALHAHCAQGQRAHQTHHHAGAQAAVHGRHFLLGQHQRQPKSRRCGQRKQHAHPNLAPLGRRPQPRGSAQHIQGQRQTQEQHRNRHQDGPSGLAPMQQPVKTSSQQGVSVEGQQGQGDRQPGNRRIQAHALNRNQQADQEQIFFLPGQQHARHALPYHQSAHHQSGHQAAHGHRGGHVQPMVKSQARCHVVGPVQAGGEQQHDKSSGGHGRGAHGGVD